MEQLREYMALNGLSINEVAKLLNCGKSSIYNWMNGHRLPNKQMAEAITKLIGEPPVDLREEVLSRVLTEPMWTDQAVECFSLKRCCELCSAFKYGFHAEAGQAANLCYVHIAVEQLKEVPMSMRKRNVMSNIEKGRSAND